MQARKLSAKRPRGSVDTVSSSVEARSGGSAAGPDLVKPTASTRPSSPPLAVESTPTEFQLRVYSATKQVPPGRVTTYAKLAAALSCGSAIAVGQALKRNPYAPVVPCHRVLSSDLTIGGFCGETGSASLQVKRKISLLRSEGVDLSPEGSLTNTTQLFPSSGECFEPIPSSVALPLLLSSPVDVRALCAAGKFTSQTSGVAPGYAQANLVILPASVAPLFKEYCEANPKPCPVLEMLPSGVFETSVLASSHKDVRTALPAYCVFKDGILTETRADIMPLWKEDFVTFLLGCSFSFESALIEAGLPIRHLELEGRSHSKTVPMYKTCIQTKPIGPFGGPLVVSMRPMTPHQAQLASKITSGFPRVHGSPVHVGDPAAIGILDLDKPDFGDSVILKHGEIPVFWACGVTPQVALVQAKLPLAITHKPGHMFVSDVLNRELRG